VTLFVTGRLLQSRLCVSSIITRRTLVWKVILVAVFSLSGYRYLGDRGTNRREIWHDGTYRSRAGLLPFWGGAPGVYPKSKILGLNLSHLTANISKTVSRSVTCQLELNISSTRLSKNVSRGAVVPRRVHPPPRTADLCGESGYSLPSLNVQNR